MLCFFFSSRRRHTRCALVTGVQTCALPILLRRAGVDVAPYDDTMLLSYALDTGRNGHGMDELCNLHLKHCPVAFKDVCGTGKSQITFDKAPLDREIGRASCRERVCQYV